MKSLSARGAARRPFAGAEHLRPQPLQLRQIGPDREQKDAAVPEIVARGDKALGMRRIGLLDKAGQREDPVAGLDRLALGDVAVAALGPLGMNAKGDEEPGPRGYGGPLDG